ncbi:uncharacterized protein N7459_000300 [Penicillium hispanicum]|uniref:uncharacterized protein n=1 Tax=Penicillium hispanicum TaxID=1080232 RepID=UPI0025408471|nr:uncharacterized protein N7459_000300 [Penicillium hispanicum]KAJ5594092.1 hypothetical protein N7459_000300 [Penicillium hispanicum]
MRRRHLSLLQTIHRRSVTTSAGRRQHLDGIPFDAIPTHKMAPLNRASQRLRDYVPPPTAYEDVPLTRRAAVLLLLYADAQGNLRVVITIRAKTLSSCTYPEPSALRSPLSIPISTSISTPISISSRSYSQTDDQPLILPGRADSLSETPFQTARREAWEEIGLPSIDQPLPAPFAVEHLCELPANLAKTELVVRPCIALLHSFDPRSGANADPEVSLIPQLDAREVAAVFTAPFHQFLSRTESVRTNSTHPTHPGRDGADASAGSPSTSASASASGEDPGEWYRGSWSLWHNSNWRMHQFFVRDDRTPRRGPIELAAQEQHRQAPPPTQAPQQAPVQVQTQRYRVFGMTARIIVDAARVAYAREPEFEHNSHLGDEAMIAKLRRLGRLSAVRKASDGLTRETMEKAAKLN